MSVLRDDLSMTIDAFLAFTEDRPDEERWELIDGEPILNPSPSYGHQKIVRNLVVALGAAEEAGAPWELLPGLGVKLSDRSMPVPDVLIRPAARITGSFCDDMIAAFEVVSPSSRKRDLLWKREAYAALPSLLHYVVLHQDRAEVHGFDRSAGWAERRSSGMDASITLEALGVTLDLASLYANTGL